MKQSLLVELNTEELPPKALKNLSEAFASGLAKGLRDRQFLSDDSVVTAFGAPRRLAVHITHVLARSPDKPFRQKLMPLAVARDAAGRWPAGTTLPRRRPMHCWTRPCHFCCRPGECGHCWLSGLHSGKPTKKGQRGQRCIRTISAET